MKTIVSIPGMHCNSCVEMIKEVSTDFPAIQKIDIDLEKKTAVLEHTDEFVLGAWAEEVQTLGDEYKVEKIS